MPGNAPLRCLPHLHAFGPLAALQAGGHRFDPGTLHSRSKSAAATPQHDDFNRFELATRATEPTPAQPASAAVWKTSHRFEAVSDTVPPGPPGPEVARWRGPAKHLCAIK
jgi:hypothetical protein